jgi:hypothetical protein
VRLRATILAVFLAGCAPEAGGVATRATVADVTAALPAARRFAGKPILPAPRLPNAQLARDFLDLTFRLESGRPLPVLTRFEGPVTIAVEPGAPPSLDADLDALIARLRREAGIDLSRAAPGERGSITIAALPRAELRRAVPGAACFVVPRVSGWNEYLRARRGPATDWTTLETRMRASVFLPSDVSPQEVRDCLHEEVAQALGPLNDLYRLPHSVFNDGNVHVVLTPFDMLMLRVTYDTALRSGLTRDQVAARLPAILDRLNPAGRGSDPGAVPESDGDWLAAIDTALGAGGRDAARLAQARRAVVMAREAGWGDSRLALARLAEGRAALPIDAEAAREALLDARSIYDRDAGPGIHSAHVMVHLAAYDLGSGDVAAALDLLDAAIPVADGAQNAGLLATLLLLRAEAVAMGGDRAAASRIRREGLAWGRYAWGDAVLARRAAEVAGLGPGA